MSLVSGERRDRRQRIELELVDAIVGSSRHRGLVAFVHYCVERIERELGVATGFDGPLAIWNAMCRIEQSLRELRGRWLGQTFDLE
jgi:hypothetical protein